MEKPNRKMKLIRVKLIFNPIAGANDESPIQLMNIIKEMQVWGLVPETFLIEAGCDLGKVVQDAIKQGIKLIVVCGGDGTIESVARAMIGTQTVLGIIPGGTANNVALSLGIPTDIPAAIRLLRKGKRNKIDIGIATYGTTSTPFIEVCSVGLFSTLYPSGDDIQHGNIGKIGDFLATFITTQPSTIHFTLDNNKEVQKLGHVVLITNMPYVGRHYQVGKPNCYKDGYLDVMFFANLTKLDIIGYVVKGTGPNVEEDPRIQHYHVKKITIETDPPMPIVVDGISLGEGSLHIEIRKHALNVIVGEPEVEDVSEKVND